MRIEPYKWLEWAYIDEKTEQWVLKDDAPEDVKKEFEEYQKDLLMIPDEEGIITVY